jgi:hypothetical protein
MTDMNLEAPVLLPGYMLYMEAVSEFVKPERIEKKETKSPFTMNPTKKAKSVDYARHRTRRRTNIREKDRSHSHLATKVNRTRSKTPIGISGQEGKQLDTLRVSFSGTRCKLCNLLGHQARNCRTYPGHFPSILMCSNCKGFHDPVPCFFDPFEYDNFFKGRPPRNLYQPDENDHRYDKKGFLKDEHRFGWIDPEQEKREIRKRRVGDWREYSVGGRLEGNTYNPYAPSRTVRGSSYLSNVNRNLPPSKTTPSGATRKLDLGIGPQLSREGVCNLKNSKNHIEPSHSSFSVLSTHTHTQSHCYINKGFMVNKETGVLSYENKHPFTHYTKQIHKGGGIKSKNKPNVNANVSQSLGKSSGHL